MSFSDGRVLCHLIHHYHPSLLPLDAIKQDTTQTYMNMNDADLSMDGENSDDSFISTWRSDCSPSVYSV